MDSEYIFHQGIQTLGGSGYPDKKVSSSSTSYPSLTLPKPNEQIIFFFKQNSARSGVSRVSLFYHPNSHFLAVRTRNLTTLFTFLFVYRDAVLPLLIQEQRWDVLTQCVCFSLSSRSITCMCFVSRYGDSQHGSFKLLKNGGTEQLRKTRTGSTGLHRPGIVSAIIGDLSGVVWFQVYCRAKLKRLENNHMQFFF